MNISINQSPQAPARTEPLQAPGRLNAFFLLLDSWFEAWALRVEARWKPTDLRSRYY